MTERTSLVDSAEDEQLWDFVIIGGGATGLGCAVDAASRGFRTLLLEQSDFAKGTSSRSTKLVHGGVRYLKQGNISLVLGALRERGLMQQNAPHVVSRQSFIVPSYSHWDTLLYGTGLKLYDLLSRRLSFGASKRLSKNETVSSLPTLRDDRLKGGIEYFDGQFDDARYSICLMRTLFNHGGVALNYMKVTRLEKKNGTVSGVHAVDLEGNTEHFIKAKSVINATGVFSDSIRKMDRPDQPDIIQASQGVHIVLDRSFLPGTSAMMVPKTDDGRVLFAVPWQNRTIVGTTDTPVDRTDLEPNAKQQELQFLLEHTGRYLTKEPAPSDVRSVFTGLRPLVRAGGGSMTKKLSRDHTLLADPSGLVTITGGKWTTYRKMAEETIDKAIETAGLEFRQCRTAKLPLHGTPATDSAARPETPFSTYGSDAARVRELAKVRDGWDRPIHPDLTCRPADIIWAVRHEMARTVEDVLSRRTRSLLLDADASVEVADTVAGLMAEELGKKEDWIRTQNKAFRETARHYRYSDLTGS